VRKQLGSSQGGGGGDTSSQGEGGGDTSRDTSRQGTRAQDTHPVWDLTHIFKKKVKRNYYTKLNHYKKLNHFTHARIIAKQAAPEPPP